MALFYQVFLKVVWLIFYFRIKLCCPPPSALFYSLYFLPGPGGLVTRLFDWRRGDYDYCRVPETRQLSSLEAGEDNSNLETKKIRKIQIDQYGRYKGFEAC